MVNVMENDSSSRQHLRAAPLLQNNVAHTGENNNQHDECFPSYLCCPITQQPPSRGVTFNVPGHNSPTTHPQVFEYSAMYRHIATQGIMQARRFVLHPITRASVRRDLALSLVIDVNDETQGMINTERLRIGLTLEDDNPLTQSDYNLYNQTMSSIQSREIYRDEIFVDLDQGEGSEDSSIGIPNRRNVRQRLEQQQVDSSSSESDHEVEDNLLATIQNGANASNQSHTSQSPGLRTNPSSHATPNLSQGSQSMSTRSRTIFGGFLNAARTGIRSSDHESGLVGVLQLASGHPEGIVSALGHNNRARWVGSNINAFFQDDGPLAGFIPVTSSVFQRHLSHAQTLARSMYNRDHSNDQTGSGQEDIPY